MSNDRRAAVAPDALEDLFAVEDGAATIQAHITVHYDDGQARELPPTPMMVVKLFGLVGETLTPSQAEELRGTKMELRMECPFPSPTVGASE
jgi:hypothetical protein